MLSFLKKVLNSRILFVIVYAIFLYFLQLVTDIKSLLVVTSLFSFSIFFLFKFSLKEVLFFILLFVFSSEKGIRGWDLVVVAPGRYRWMYGYDVYYGLSLRTLVTAAMFFISLPELINFFKSRINKRTIHILFLLSGFLIFVLASTYFSSDYFLSFFGLLRILQAIFLFFSVLILFQNGKFKEYFFIGITMILLFNGYVSLKQYVNSGPLGLFLEDGKGYNNKGFFTTDGAETLYRTSGFIGHPTFFASYMSMLISVCLGYIVNLINQSKKIYIKVLTFFSVILGIFAVYTSFVRSSWFSLVFIVSSFIGFIVISKKSFFKKINKWLYLVIFSFLAIFLVTFGQTFWMRVISSTEFLSDGSGVVRISLIQEALKMTKNNPVWGVGLNLSTRMMTEQTLLPPELRGFMFPVHNTFILFLAEVGIPATTFFILFILFTLFYSFKYLKKDFKIFGIWLAIIAFIFNAQVHTLFNQDPSFDLLFILLGFLTHLCLEKKLR